MPNALAHETSPYLLQHADNPVAWLPWGETAFERARREDKPIFLSIGYAACHWCHVMAHESFEDVDTAALLNEHFVPVKVDREERPDVDSLYMDAVVSMTGRGGWPASVFLTPDGKPFFAGTYFPPSPRHGLPAFREVLRGVARAWREDRAQLLDSAGRVAEQLAVASAALPPGGDLRSESLDAAAEGLWRGFDAVNGGWGAAPKFPAALAIEFLLRRSVRSRDVLARDLALQALEAMAAGGIHDQLAGGFHRYTVDAGWTVPHFEKMLYDNALLARVYLLGWLATGRARLRQVAEATLDFMLAELATPEGGLASSLDADSEGEEGRYYVWTEEEFRAALADPALEELALAVWGVTAGGNFEGRNVLTQAMDEQAIEARFAGKFPDWRAALQEARRRLVAARGRRERPARDDKVLTAWNGLALMSLAEAARALPDPRYLAAAQRLAAFLLEKPRLNGHLARSWRNGQARQRAYLEDHAALGLGCLALYQTDFNLRWFDAAREQAEAILGSFSDPEGGFFDTGSDHEPLFARPRTIQDSPVPSGSALAVLLLLHLSALTGDARFEQAALPPLGAMQEVAVRHPSAFAAWLCALDWAIGPVLQLALVGEPAEPSFAALARPAQSRYAPRLVVAGGPPGTAGQPALLRDRAMIEGRPTAYLCQAFTCQLPVTEPGDLERQLAQALPAPVASQPRD